jgi:hypothetical protein
MNTKAYVILLGTIVVIGFGFIGLILFHDPVLVKARFNATPVVICLNLDSMKEASDSVIRTFDGPAVCDIYPARHQNDNNDIIPWADAYLCHTFSKADSSSGDTLVLLLDTKINSRLYRVKYPSEYWTGLKKASKFRKCRIMLTREQLTDIRNARYKFASVQLITDDDSELK